jgi:hypothetical protein
MKLFPRLANFDILDIILNVFLLFLLLSALKENMDTQRAFKAKCLSEGGKFTNGFVFILPTQTCTYN